MATKKKRSSNTPATKKSSENSFLDTIVDFINSYENTEKKIKKVGSFYDRKIYPYIKAFIEQEPHYEKILLEQEQENINRAIDDENKKISKNLDALLNFHKNCNALTVNEYLEKSNSEHKEKLYKELVNGGEEFRDYVLINIRNNIERGFKESEYYYQTVIYTQPLKNKQLEVDIFLSYFEKFNPIKQLSYDAETDNITPDYFDDNERKTYYKDFLYSMLLQIISVMFQCAYNVYDSENKCLVDTVVLKGFRSFLDDSYGTYMPFPIVSVTMPKDEFWKINLDNVNPEKVFTRLKATTYTDLFYTDEYEHDKLKELEKENKQRLEDKKKKSSS